MKDKIQQILYIICLKYKKHNKLLLKDFILRQRNEQKNIFSFYSILS